MTPPAALAVTADAREMRLPTLLSALGLTPSLAQPLPDPQLVLAGLADIDDLTTQENAR
ncbi:hypothetical protein [Streptomyces sp. MJP52]|uniref:hypothetical protein n=1 Tax=Streptomyces sp. MJP52 TaxID=2940555 RepID=UPI0024751496|nr:hypothetical protein [Streptomyces sp. MJP52]MDH6224302.1 hypothetical protein [Streptomyces sp. MJP52]